MNYKIIDVIGAKKTGSKTYLGRCPLPKHGKGRGDKRPSLSITDVGKVNPLIYCHAGCDFKDLRDYFVKNECWDTNFVNKNRRRKYVLR